MIAQANEIGEGQAVYVTEEGVLIGIIYGGELDYGVRVYSLPQDGRMRYSFEKESWYWPKDVATKVAKDRLNDEFTQAMTIVQNGWPLHEVLTWYKQDKESEAWAKAPSDAKPDTPFLSSLFEKCAALGSSDTFEGMIARIRSNDSRYTEAVTSIMAVKHVAEDNIDASDDPISVTWQFP